MPADNHPADRRGLLGGPLRKPLRRACLTLAVVTAVVIAVIVFTPGPPGASGQQLLRLWIERLHQLHRLPGFITFGLVEFVSNVVMFVPLGFLLAGALRPRSRRWVVPLALLLSIGIELVQAAYLPERTAALSDVIANVVGAGIGLLLLAATTRRAWAARSAHSRSLPRKAQQQEPSAR